MGKRSPKEGKKINVPKKLMKNDNDFQVHLPLEILQKKKYLPQRSIEPLKNI